MSRNFVIGDIHGSNVAFELLLNEINVQPEDTIITLGDYIDRGTGSPQVIDRLIALSEQCKLITLMGNHELMVIRSLEDKSELRSWMFNGGVATLNSYGFAMNEYYDDPRDVIRKWIPREHMQFMAECFPYYEDEKNIYVHANYHPDLSLNEQKEEMTFWEHLDFIPDPHISGKTAWVGHTPQTSGKIKDEGHIICVDTGSFLTGWLTAVETNTGEIIQANNTTYEIRKSRRKSK